MSGTISLPIQPTFNVICLKVLPDTLIPVSLSSFLSTGLMTSSLYSLQIKSSYLVPEAPSPHLPGPDACRRGQIYDCSPLACFLQDLCGSDAIMYHVDWGGKVNRESEEGGRTEREREGRGVDLSATLCSNLPCSTCMWDWATRTAIVKDWESERKGVCVCWVLSVVQHHDAAVVGVDFKASWCCLSEYVCWLWEGAAVFTPDAQSLLPLLHPSSCLIFPVSPSSNLTLFCLKPSNDWILEDDVSKFVLVSQCCPPKLEGKDQYCKNKSLAEMWGRGFQGNQNIRGERETKDTKWPEDKRKNLRVFPSLCHLPSALIVSLRCHQGGYFPWAL